MAARTTAASMSHQKTPVASDSGGSFGMGILGGALSVHTLLAATSTTTAPIHGSIRSRPARTGAGISAECPFGNDPVDGVNKKQTPWDGWHTFYVVHSNGYTTWYLHTRAFSPVVQQQILTQGYATVTQLQSIAEVGHFGLTSGDHLHFEVRKNGSNARSAVVDPYGWLADPELWAN